MIWGGLKHDKIVEVILYGTFVVCLLGIGFYFWKLKHSKTQKVDGDMERALAHLKKMPNGVVMCFPQHWNEIMAYKAKKPVLWGAHGFGFNLVEVVFPRLLKPIKEVISEYKVKYLLTYNGYLPENFLEELPDSSLFKFGVYHLFTFR